MAITLTKAVAYASGADAGNRSMRAGGRSAWSLGDYNHAAQETLHRMVQGGHMTPEMAARCGYELPAQSRA